MKNVERAIDAMSDANDGFTEGDVHRMAQALADAGLLMPDHSFDAEGVPAGEPWIVQHENGEWIGCRNNPGSRLPWFVIGKDYHDFDYCSDSDITLISRLVPEVKP